jgi:transposase InsO family protein
MPSRAGMMQSPAPSTITAILRRHDLLVADSPPRDFVRFEHPIPNALWQMDFMGHRALAEGRVHPLSLLDDHSRFALGLAACADEQQATVKALLTAILQR